MDTIFMNSEHSKTSNSRRLFLNLSDKKHLKKDKYVALSNISIYYTWKNIKKACKNNKLSAPTWYEKFELRVRPYFVLYQGFKIILNISSKNMIQLLKILQ